MADRQDWTDDLLRDVVQRPAVPDGDFMARLMADAVGAQNVTTAPPSRGRAWSGMWHWLWPSGGLTAALACGIWLGMSPQSFMAPYLHAAELAVEPYQILDVYTAIEEVE